MILTKIVSESRFDWEMKLNSTPWAYQVTYKMALGTMPFNLTFGMNVVLPMDFLIPTLWVAKTLKWYVHELSKRSKDLERLDETKLMVIAYM